MRVKTRTGMLVALVGALGLIFGSFTIANAAGDSATSAGEVSASEVSASEVSATQASFGAAQTTNDEGHEPGDHPPADNNPNPEEPPCDADHGHPGDNAPQCDDEDHPGNNGQKPGNGDDDDDDNGELGTCEQDGLLQENTVANEVFGTENEEGPISSALHDNEPEFQELEPVVHEASCVVATVDNNFPDDEG